MEEKFGIQINAVRDEVHDKDYGEGNRLRPAENDDSSLAVLSLHRLESDIRKLQDKWHSVEEDLKLRDAVIAELNSELELRHANLKSLHDELGAVEAEREKMADDMIAANRTMENLERTVEQKDLILSERKREIEGVARQVEEAKAAYDQALANSEAIEASLRDERKRTADVDARIRSSDQEAGQLRETIQGLESYIDRRKAEWERLNVELEDYRNTLVGMEKTIKSGQAEIDKREDEKAALAMSIMEFEQRIAELDGRLAERISIGEELQQLLDQRSRESESLASELKGEKISADRLRTRISSLEARIEALLADAGRERERAAELERRLIEAKDAQIKNAAELAALTADRDRSLEACRTEERAVARELAVERDALLQKSSELDEQLARERARAESLDLAQADAQSALLEANARIAALDGELASHERQYADLQQKFEAQQAESAEVWAELKQSIELRANAESRMAVSEAKAVDFETVNKAFSEELGQLRDKLVSKNQLIVQLETKLDACQETISLLDRNAQRLSEIGSDVQSLDQRITSDTGPEDAKRKSDAQKAMVTRAIIAMNGDQKHRFPLYKKTMTIGRAFDNDILLGWKYISRNHARITCLESGVRIEDVGSKNGIVVNNEPVHSVHLHDGDSVEIGKVHFQYIESKKQPAAAAKH